MLNVRATPISSTLPNPAELMFGRKISTTLPGYQHIVVNDDTREHFANLSNQQKNHTMMKNLENYHHSWLIKLYVYTTPIRNFGLLERFCQMMMNDLTKSSPRVVEFFSETDLRQLVLPEYTTQRSIYENGDRPTNNNVTPDVPDVPSPKPIVSQSSNVSISYKIWSCYQSTITICYILEIRLLRVIPLSFLMLVKYWLNPFGIRSIV